MATYEFEIFSSTGALIMDITGLIKQRRFKEGRNEEETLEFELDLNDFEARCADVNEDPNVVLYPYRSEILLKRNGVYRRGFVVYDLNFSGDESGEKIQVKCDGYLNLFKDRYITKSYTQVNPPNILADMVETTQAEPNGDFGIVMGTVPDLVGIRRDRNFDRKNIKDEFVNITNLEDGRFDFEFAVSVTNGQRTITLNFYEQIGDDNTDLPLVYPDNILSYSMPRTGVTMFNHITALGSGLGDEKVVAPASDTTSMLNNGRHEKIVTYNDVKDPVTLQEHADAELALQKDMIEIPNVVIDPTQVDLADLNVGDRRKVQILRHAMLASVNGIFKLERIEVALDDNDAENISLTFDSYDVILS